MRRRSQTPDADLVEQLLSAGAELKSNLARLRFGPPVSHVYNPLEYAWECYASYVRQFAATPKRIVFLGMNPGPFGMVQTGVPFGEVKAVSQWLRVKGAVLPPAGQHPRRPVLGLDCPRSEVSGQRLWGLFAEKFGSAELFFADHFVLNYCPLAFMEANGRNRTPDKLPAHEREPLFTACDRHLQQAIKVLQPDWIIGVGDFARRCGERVFPEGCPRTGQILHPSPANPEANRGWATVAHRQLVELGIWTIPRRKGRESRVRQR